MGSIVAIQGILFPQKFVIKGDLNNDNYKNILGTSAVLGSTTAQHTSSSLFKPHKTPPKVVIGELNTGGGTGNTGGGTGNTGGGTGNTGGGTGNTGGGAGGNWETSPPDNTPWTGSGWDNIGLDGLPPGQQEEFKVLAMDNYGCPIYGYDDAGNPLYGKDTDGNIIKDPKVLPCYLTGKDEGEVKPSSKSDRNFKLVGGFIIAIAIGVAIFK